MVNGGRKHFEPATDKEIKKIMRGLGRKEYMPNLVSLPYEKNQRRKEQYIPLLDEQLDDQLVDEFLSFLMRGDFPHLVEVPNCGKDDEDN